MVTEEYDVVIIGTGSAGSTVAYDCASAGLKVAMADSRPFGGTCKLRGCDPKKVLVGAGQLQDWSRRMKGDGWAPDGAHIDWPELMRFKRTFTAGASESTEKGFKDAGMATYHGVARFLDGTTLKVGDAELRGRNVVIATGGKPAEYAIPGWQLLTTSEQFLDLDELPDDIIFVGGGYISFEFAHLAARAGARVRILETGNRPLHGFDPDLVQMAVDAGAEVGIEVRSNAHVQAVEKTQGRMLVHASVGDGVETFETDMAVHGAGRVAALDELDLEAGGVQREKHGVSVNEYMQSVSNPAVYAAGDAAARGLALTPVATKAGSVVATNLLNGNQRKLQVRGIATVVFTEPPLAAVGMKEEDAQEEGIAYKVNHADTSSWYGSRRLGVKHSGYKVLVAEDDGRILGAHLLEPSAEETINLFAIAVRLRLTTAQLKDVIYTYPTNSYDTQYML